MEIIFEKGDKVNVKGYRSEGVVNVTFTTESRDFGFDIVRVQMGGIELTVPSDEVTAVAAPVEAATVEESAPVDLASVLVQGELLTSNKMMAALSIEKELSPLAVKHLAFAEECREAVSEYRESAKRHRCNHFLRSTYVELALRNRERARDFTRRASQL